MSVRPSALDTRQNLVRALIEGGRPDQAVVEATHLVTIADSLQNRLLLGRAYLSRGQVADACREMQRAFAFEPRNSSVQLELAACWARNADLDAALLHANAVVKREPANQIAIVLVEAITKQQRGRRWLWLPLLLALGAACAAIGARKPDQWEHRRIALGILALSVVSAIWLATAWPFWFAGGLWAAYQFYAALAHRRMRAANAGSRTAYLISASRVLGCVCLADGEMHDAELRRIRATYERASFSEADLAVIGRELRRCADEFRSKVFEHEALYAVLHAACGDFGRLSNEAMRLELFRTAVDVALSDGQPTPGELHVLRACGTWMNISDAAQEEIWKGALLDARQKDPWVPSRSVDEPA